MKKHIDKIILAALITAITIVLGVLATLLITTNTSLAYEIKVFDFTETELSKLEVRKVRGADNITTYTVGTN